MNKKDLTSLMYRAAACIEAPGDLTENEIDEVLEDLVCAAHIMNDEEE